MNGTNIPRVGFGMMRLTGQPGNFGPYGDWDAAIALLHEAADLGVGLFDSARSYGPLHADRLLGEALWDRDVWFATKGGVDKRAPGRITVDGRRDTLHREIDEALVNLRRDRIDLFQLHRVDPSTPLEVSVEALEEARQDGRIARIGLSNVTIEQLERARAVAPIASVQNRYNLAERGDDAMLDYTAVHGILYLPYGPLGANPMRPGAPLSAADALGWLVSRSPNVVPIPGTTSRAHLRENVAAMRRP